MSRHKNEETQIVDIEVVLHYSTYPEYQVVFCFTPELIKDFKSTNSVF